MKDVTLLSGWGRTAPTGAAVFRPATVAGVQTAVVGAGPRGLLARGLGRAYGDAAQDAGGTVLDLTGLAAIDDVDLSGATSTVQAGVSLDRLMRALLPLGLFVPVTPGTRFVTVGGAVAADIHGKNHHVDGSFTDHLDWVDLVDGHGDVRRLLPGQPELAATAGGMGLTGVVVAARIRMTRVATSRMVVDTERACDLDDLMDRMTHGDDRFRYSVAWIDCLARGPRMGRAVLTRGEHAPVAALSERAAADPLSFQPAQRLSAPGLLPGGLLNRATVAAFNEAWYRKAPRHRIGEVQSIATFFHPLDGVAAWNRIYGPRGFVQYQFVVPFGAEDALRTALTRISGEGCPSFLAVLKRFGAASPGHLSFPAPGWTLALDVPSGADGLAALLDGLDDLVAAAGGRVYLAKDARLRPELLATMYPRLAEWQDVRAGLDPDRVFASDLARRLGL